MGISVLKEGDILLWWDDKFQIQVGSKLWTIPIPCPISVHADLYIGGGKCITSIQNLGSSVADVAKRMKQFYKWEAVRITDPECVIGQAVSTAKSLKCEYDWMGYYGQYLDVFVSGLTFPFPDFSSKSDAWTDKLASKDSSVMYCSAFVARAFDPYRIAGKEWRLTSPQDIHEYAKKNVSLRKIIEF
jgi:hypothetical protein